jgi:NADPH2:quinone reductase
VLIDVRAIGINYPDFLMLQGKYQTRPALPFVPGRDAAGVVAAVGEGVAQFKPGDRVAAQVFSGAFAEKLAAPQVRCFKTPPELDFAAAAAMMTAYNTAYVAIVFRGKVQSGESVLVTGASGGVGLACVQLLKAMGATVLAGVSTPAKGETARAHGADYVIDLRADNLRDALPSEVLKVTKGRGVDAVIDTVGGDVFDAAIRALAFEGRLVVVGFASGKIPAAEANRILFRGISIIGAPLDIHFTHAADRLRRGVDEMLAMAAQGRLRPHVTATYPLERFREAFARIQNREVQGKIVLLPH